MGTTSSRTLQYILKALKQGNGVSELRTEMQGLESQGKDTTKMTKQLNVAQAALGAAAVLAAKKVIAEGIELVKLGGQVNRSEIALTAFAGSSSEADKALQGVIEASGGALDKMSAAQNAARLFSMGLADTADEANQLAEIGITLGTAMGRDTQTAFEDFSLLLANQSIPRLDTFGISAGRTRTRINELMESVDGLQRDEAFKMAVIEQGVESLEKLEAQGYESATGLEQVKASAENVKQAMGELLFSDYEDSGLSEALTFVLNGMTEVLDKANDFEKISDQMHKLVDSGVIDITEQIEQVGTAYGVTFSTMIESNWGHEWANQIDEFGGGAREAEILLENLADAEEYLGVQTDDLSFKTRESIDQFNYWVAASEKYIEGGYEMVDVNDNLSDSIDDVSWSLDDSNTSLANTIEKQKEAIQWIEAGGLALQEEARIIREEYESGAITAAEATERLIEIQVEAMRITGEFDGMSLGGIIEKIMELGLNFGEAKKMAEGTYWALQKINGSSVYADIYITKHVSGGGGSGSNSGSGGGTGTSNNPNPSNKMDEMEFATGGRFEVDGMPGRDKVPVTMLMEKGEVGLVYNKEQQRNLMNYGGGGNQPIHVHVYVDGREIQESIVEDLRRKGLRLG